MAVDDSPLSLVDPGSPEPDDGGASSPTGDGQAAASPGEQLGAILRQTIQPIAEAGERRTAQLEQRINQLTDLVARTVQGGQAAPAAPAARTAEDRDARVKRFVEDPYGYEDDLRTNIAGEVRKQVLSEVAPYLVGPAKSAQEQTLSREEQRVDARYGPGTFNEVVRPHIDSALGHLAEPHRANPDALRAAVSALMGSEPLQDALLERHTKHAQAQAQAKATQRQAPPSFLGRPGMPGGGGEPRPITPEDRIVLDAISRATGGDGMSEREQIGRAHV